MLVGNSILFFKRRLMHEDDCPAEPSIIFRRVLVSQRSILIPVKSNHPSFLFLPRNIQKWYCPVFWVEWLWFVCLFFFRGGTAWGLWFRQSHHYHFVLPAIKKTLGDSWKYNRNIRFLLPLPCRSIYDRIHNRNCGKSSGPMRIPWILLGKDLLAFNTINDGPW